MQLTALRRGRGLCKRTPSDLKRQGLSLVMLPTIKDWWASLDSYVEVPLSAERQGKGALASNRAFRQASDYLDACMEELYYHARPSDRIAQLEIIKRMTAETRAALRKLPDPCPLPGSPGEGALPTAIMTRCAIEVLLQSWLAG